jgi:hypothetical protein
MNPFAGAYRPPPPKAAAPTLAVLESQNEQPPPPPPPVAATLALTSTPPSVTELACLPAEKGPDGFKSGITVHTDAAWQHFRPGIAQATELESGAKGKGKMKAAEAALLVNQVFTLNRFNFRSHAGSAGLTGKAPSLAIEGPTVNAVCPACRAETHDGICRHCNGQGNFPWWETTEQAVRAMAYHLRTRLDGVVGLLVDPGAHDNLVGDRTLAIMARQARESPILRPLASPMSVEGVGKSAQTASNAGQVPIGIGGSAGTYTAPVIPDSDLPPLLGMRTLEGRQAILDCGNHRLIMPGPGGVHIQLSPGSLVFPLEKSSSGHLILPITNFPKEGKKTAEDERLAFATSRPLA